MIKNHYWSQQKTEYKLFIRIENQVSSLEYLILVSSTGLNIGHQHYAARHGLSDIVCNIPTFK